MSSLPFKKYSSIENSYREKFVAQCFSAIAHRHCLDDFVVEEKAHGSNFGFYYDGTELKTACRSMFLEDDGRSFVKSHFIKEKYTNAIHKLYELLGSSGSIRVIGEIIGGTYDHPEVPPCNDLKRIQKGIDYCPGHEFYAFDLSILSEEGPDDGEISYVTPDKMEMNKLFQEVGIPYAKPLFRGTLEECLAYDNTFKSHIPGWLGLPEHPGKNIAEGKVIKPVHYACLGNGDRIILKDKTDSFAEVAYGKEHAKKPKAKKAKPTPALSDVGMGLLQMLGAHATENRLQNVISKLPEPPTSKDIGRVCGLMSHDALEDFNKDFGTEFDSLPAKERKAIKKSFAEEVKTLVLAALLQD